MTKNGDGFVGFYDVNDYFFGSHNYSIFSSIASSQGLVSDLIKIVSYTDASGIRHIVAIGTTSGQYCLVNVTYNNSTGTWDYETGVIPTSLSETLVEIRTTDDLIFTVGFNYRDVMNPSLMARVYDKGFVFNPSIYGIQNYVNEIADPFQSISFCLDQVVADQMFCNDICLAAFWKNHQDTGTVNPILYQEPKGTYLGKFVLGKQKPLIVHQKSLLTMHNYYNGGWKLHGFSYKNQNTSYYNLLQEYETSPSGDLSSCIYELEDNIFFFALPFVCAMEDRYSFQGIDGHRFQPCYLLNGIKKSDNSVFVYNMGQPGGNKCLDKKYVTPVNTEIICSEIYSSFTVLSDNAIFTTFKAVSDTLKVSIDCSSKGLR